MTNTEPFNLPEPLRSIKKLQFLYPHASPIEPLNRLTSELSKLYPGAGSKPKLWIKREDSNSGVAFGGNKIRKLEYVVADAVEKGATVLVSTGGLQSNHMRHVAAAAVRSGLKAHLLPNDLVKSTDLEYKNLGNIQMTHLLGAEHSPYDSDPDEILKSLAAQGEIPYWIPSGASTHPLGGLGYARFAFELVQQEVQMGVYFDTIIVACASGSTLGGMIAGFKFIETLNGDGGDEGRMRRVAVGVDAFAGPPGKTKESVLRSSRTTAAVLGLDQWNAGSYGFVDERTRGAIKLLAGLEGILTDPVYTGKALAGVIEKYRLGEFSGRENVLFVHTGGVASLSAYPNVR
ncbi:1-aminocyclopropane-1-carboxylate deaminase [Rhexocercosporidium sp. MPI-PUGE-AT-0058]|nr:1-aminocyclopropane-1-carboxylate deaminase [Rhexocercosporidium sp. MPI-PUGE-AT-0058]